ncbi:MAG TPA: TetR family transcriptional regulator, partial [Acidimicrobiales bacterium]
MIDAAAELFRQRGYHATTFSDVVNKSGAPRGSTYFHFPGGKQELAREAIAMAGDEIEEMVEQAARHADTPGSVVRALAQMLADRFERSGYQSGCAIATMVLELAPRDEEFSADFDSVFARWRAALVSRFEPLGVAAGRAAVLADLTISALEGALLLSRAARSIEPFKAPIEALISAIDHDTASQPAAPRGRARHPQPTPACSNRNKDDANTHER